MSEVNEEQIPDQQPGQYYVSVVDGKKFGLLSGPYSSHAAALALVDRARRIATDLNDWAHFYSYGTVRMADDFNQPGSLQKWGYALDLKKRNEE